jgi:hypothetical protein
MRPSTPLNFLWPEGIFERRRSTECAVHLRTAKGGRVTAGWAFRSIRGWNEEEKVGAAAVEKAVPYEFEAFTVSSTQKKMIDVCFVKMHRKILRKDGKDFVNRSAGLAGRGALMTAKLSSALSRILIVLFGRIMLQRRQPGHITFTSVATVALPQIASRTR